jgi:hypothetical protein
MNKPFYNGSGIEISKDFIRIKKGNYRIDYKDILSIRIKKTRIDRAWIIYILTGLIALSIILFVFCYFIAGLFFDPGLVNQKFYTGKRVMILWMLLFLGGPFFIILKIKKYFRKHMMLIIKWGHHDFRINISGMNINLHELERFLEGKIDAQKFEINSNP